ncbi:hypothetical protein [Vagococcus intermedius]|uniref:Gram-positive cocci surface proteins LPxTG domain-containing protein n=1 Tax=Vagococcus intermedius TaxID=2991418 RepID=A0AAF0CVC8_9ENTE|nr:hypothetical protein [Vagococcus intermedius]WEG73598.1 hypothetical protein OL234_01450 [Vagococcus intermedius]WEG75682.1 hypothetical protein OL235_01460 [Vagococcus intermedius]
MKQFILKSGLVLLSLGVFQGTLASAEAISPTEVISEASVSFDWTDYKPLPGTPEETEKPQECPPPKDQEGDSCPNEGNDSSSCPPLCSGGVACQGNELGSGQLSANNEEKPQLGGGWQPVSTEYPTNNQKQFIGNLPQTGETNECTNIGVLLTMIASSMVYIRYKFKN